MPGSVSIGWCSRSSSARRRSRIGRAHGGIMKDPRRFVRKARSSVLAVALAVLACLPSLAHGEEPDVTVLRLPDGALQPHVIAAADGSAHLLYFQGPAEAGDVYYTRLTGTGPIPAARRV